VQKQALAHTYTQVFIIIEHVKVCMCVTEWCSCFKINAICQTLRVTLFSVNAYTHQTGSDTCIHICYWYDDVITSSTVTRNNGNCGLFVTCETHINLPATSHSSLCKLEPKQWSLLSINNSWECPHYNTYCQFQLLCLLGIVNNVPVPETMSV
jgi:hypothetical protein